MAVNQHYDLKTDTYAIIWAEIEDDSNDVGVTNGVLRYDLPAGIDLGHRHHLRLEL